MACIESKKKRIWVLFNIYLFFFGVFTMVYYTEYPLLEAILISFYRITTVYMIIAFFYLWFVVARIIYNAID